MYTTELMQKILTSPAAQEIVAQLAPIYGQARVALWIFQAIGLEIDEMSQWADEVFVQIVPQTATWSLPYWEGEYGLSPDPTLDIEKRRLRVLSKKRYRAPMNPYKLGQIASAASISGECRIEERTKYPSHFTVWVSGVPSEADKSKIAAAVDYAKEARLSFDVRYEQMSSGTVYVGGIIQMGYDITIRQV